VECVKRCEFQKFTGTKFICELYDGFPFIYLVTTVKENGDISVLRCNQCIKEKNEYDLIKQRGGEK